MAVWIQSLYQYAYTGRLSSYPWQFKYRVSTSMTTWKGSICIHGSLNAESLPVCLFEKALYISMAVWIQSLYQYAYTGRLSSYPWQFEYRVSTSMSTWKGSLDIHGSLNAESVNECELTKYTHVREKGSFIHGSFIAECKTFNKCELIKFIVHEPTAVHRSLNTD